MKKKNLNIEKINFFYLIRFFYLLIFSIILIPVIYNYKSNLILYIIFSLIILFALFISTDKKNNIVFNFIFFFIFFGFWFKYSLNYLLEFKYISNIGKFDFYDKNNLDYIIKVSIVSVLSFYLPFFLKIKFFNFNLYNHDNYIEYFFKKKRKIISFFIYFLLISIPVLNFFFNFYEKGKNYDSDKKYFYYFFNFWINYFAPTLLSYIVFISIKFDNLKQLFILILEPLLSSISILSRWIILIYYSYFIGIISSINFKIKNLYLIYLILFFLISSLVSNFIVYELRELKLLKSYEIKTNLNKNSNQENIKEVVNKKHYFIDIFLNRFLGIDGVMAVTSSKNQSFTYFINGINFSEVPGKISYYEKNYLFKNTNDNKFFLKDNIISQNSPGIIAFLLFSGSEFFMCIMIFFITFFLIKLENILNLLFNNKIFVTFIMFSITYRIFHFGYDPLNSYKFFVSLCICLLSIVLINRIMKFYHDKIT